MRYELQAVQHCTIRLLLTAFVSIVEVQLVAPYIVMLVARSAQCLSIQAVQLVAPYMVMLVAPCMRTDLIPVCFALDPDSQVAQYARYRNLLDCGTDHLMLEAIEMEVAIFSG